MWNFLLWLVDILLHLDSYITLIIENFGWWTYAILFFVIFCETGLVIMPFLPGDTLLFAAGAVTANPENALNIVLLRFLLFAGAVLGDFVNYEIGRFLGPKVFKKDYKFLKKSHLEKTRDFYSKYGPVTIIYARFLPVIRTFAPFVAGIGEMKYSKFFMYNVVGAFLWTAIFTFGGYWFGGLPIIADNFTLMILGIFFISWIPVIITRFSKNKKKKNGKDKSLSFQDIQKNYQNEIKLLFQEEKK